MFYSLNILARKDGKFSVIWLAATRARKLSKKQCETVNLCNSCNELCKHIPSPDRVRSAERFSLYLCSQLMFGIVVIFHRKHEYLLRELEQMVSCLRRIYLGALELPPPPPSSEAGQRDDQNILHDVRELLERPLEEEQFSSDISMEEVPLSTELTSSLDLLELLSASEAGDAITMEEPKPIGKSIEFEGLMSDFFGESAAQEDFPFGVGEELETMNLVDVPPSEELPQTVETTDITSAALAEPTSNDENIPAPAASPKRSSDRPQAPASDYLESLARPPRTRKKFALHDRRITLRSRTIRKQLASYSGTVLPLGKVLAKEPEDEHTIWKDWIKRPGMRILSSRLTERYEQALKVLHLAEPRGDLVSEAILEEATVPEPSVDVVQSNTESSLEVQRGRTLDSTGSLRNIGMSAEEVLDVVHPSTGLDQMQSFDSNFQLQDTDAALEIEKLAPPDSTGVTELIAYGRAAKRPLHKKVVTSDSLHSNDQLLEIINKEAKDKDYIRFADLCPPEATSRRTAAQVFSSLLELHSMGKLWLTQGEYMSDIRISTRPSDEPL